MGLKTPLYDTHARAGAKIVDFGGWDMPLHYGSQLEEHHAVRRDAGVFDVSHMASLDIEGARATDFLRILLANDVAKLRSAGKGLYSCLLKHDGGVLDDLIVYRMHETRYRMVVNAGTREKDLAWIRAHADAYGVEVAERRDLAMLAVQGPQARAKAATLLAGENAAHALALPVFSAAEIGGWFVARTGYTGEDGFEIALPAAEASAVWAALTASARATPCAWKRASVCMAMISTRLTTRSNRVSPGPWHSMRRNAGSSVGTRSNARARHRAANLSAFCSRSAAYCAAISA
jgi:aminomethyltransferase